MFDFFITSHLIPTNQSGFIPKESCINQLLSIAHGIYIYIYIYVSFDKG